MRRTGVALTLGAAVACAAVPTLTFESRDAAPDVESDAPSRADGGGDASDDGSAGCPGSNPQAAYVCCGAVMCQGGDCSGQCDACVAKCTSPGDVCCPKNNNVVCFAPGTICR